MRLEDTLRRLTSQAHVASCDLVVAAILCGRVVEKLREVAPALVEAAEAEVLR